MWFVLLLLVGECLCPPTLLEPLGKWEGFGAQEPATASTVILDRVYTSLLF